ncbi:MAG TPA: hypothetical protein PKE53_06405 [Flavobacteriales bacterium]|jgi:hypothetical protein|nr:hypothetical protein [Flavobacteriales bacterium]MCC6654838.1 hypothetical protein [Flavobacteriales bacterium]HMU13617.1 hypothetical protein [Flavobacteriales bacterium]HMW98599.1 hypothetical protein [Flavobacteriales bacterium]HMZ48571.1 hypothetical protein [Flavobacteriales bacterium]
MKTSILLRAACVTTLVTALCGNASGSDGTLLLDGRVLVPNGDISNASVTVLKGAEEVRKLSVEPTGFTMKLALDETYTLVFAKPGHVTKELVFDTHTPADLTTGRVFNFRFQVSLEASPDGAEYSYDSPLAVIKFDGVEGEFGYDRQHAKPLMVKAAPVRKQRREATAFVDPSTQLDAWVAQKRDEQ